MEPELYGHWIPEDVFLQFLYSLRNRLEEAGLVDAAILNHTAQPAKVSRKTHIERSQWISDRHLLWGKNAPCLNIDFFFFLVLEYDEGDPVALIEYKHREESPIVPQAKSALTRLAQRAALPAFEVRYDPEEIKYRVEPYFLPGHGGCCPDKRDSQ